jgi:hypothetical protein
LIWIVDLPLMPFLHGRLMQVENRSDIDHGPISLSATKTFQKS